MWVLMEVWRGQLYANPCDLRRHVNLDGGEGVHWVFEEKRAHSEAGVRGQQVGRHFLSHGAPPRDTYPSPSVPLLPLGSLPSHTFFTLQEGAGPPPQQASGMGAPGQPDGPDVEGGSPTAWRSPASTFPSSPPPSPVPAACLVSDTEGSATHKSLWRVNHAVPTAASALKATPSSPGKWKQLPWAVMGKESHRR